MKLGILFHIIIKILSITQYHFFIKIMFKLILKKKENIKNNVFPINLYRENRKKEKKDGPQEEKHWKERSVSWNVNGVPNGKSGQMP